ncbi:antitoxin [uncultured Corynebacterium sp.]|uniref:antitoxin n=1 Tax=uncultured Corynebacterium sp. TaxID=159447 RepID=UPI0025F2B266|nr:antitoxin [uncultured Corynebacterium sp.]
MGVFDKAKQFADDNPDKVSQGIDKAGDTVDERTGGKHSEHVDKAQDAARKKFADGEGEPQQ